MRIRAALLVRPGRALEVVDLELAAPGRDEVLVRLHASGICRSDLSLQDGKWPVPLPIVLGHEGAGVVERVGAGVPASRVGEHVVLTFAPACGRCRFCLMGRVNLCLRAAAGYESGTMHDGTTRLGLDGLPVYHLAFVSSFATHGVVPAAGAIPVPRELDLSLACLLGCGITTGVMSVTHRANVRPGESVAVFGCGGVGLAAVQGARLVSAEPVVAVEPVAAKRELALALGATHTVDPTDGDPAEAVRALVPGGVDYVFEALGNPTVAEQAFRSVRDGGTTVLIGQPAIGVAAAFPVYDLTQFEHSILGTNLGGATPALHVPQLAALAVSGRLDLASMVTHRFRLDQINEAMETANGGSAGRVILELA